MMKVTKILSIQIDQAIFHTQKTSFINKNVHQAVVAKRERDPREANLDPRDCAAKVQHYSTPQNYKRWEYLLRLHYA